MNQYIALPIELAETSPSGDDGPFTDDSGSKSNGVTAVKFKDEVGKISLGDEERFDEGTTDFGRHLQRENEWSPNERTPGRSGIMRSFSWWHVFFALAIAAFTYYTSSLWRRIDNLEGYVTVLKEVVTELATTECTPEDWSEGRWTPKTPRVHTNTSRLSVYEASGFPDQCAHFHELDWFLGTTHGEMQQYRWDASQYDWTPYSEECKRVARAGWDTEAFIKDLVENGGWLLVGDSITEQHFFSISCILAPHVVVKWGAGGPRQQYMYLRKNSTMVPKLTLPPGFFFDETPLVASMWSEHGFNKDELIEIYESYPQFDTISADKIFTSYPVVSPPVKEYFGIFLNSTLRYQSMIFNTGAHWTVREFAFPGGNADILKFYNAVTKRWAEIADEQMAMDTEGRELVVRSCSSGHTNCRSYHKPVEQEVGAPPVPEFNWEWIPKFNDALQATILKLNVSKINFLSIDRPARLRPDGHGGDCLHVAVGVGVYEGWSVYISYFLKSRLTPISSILWKSKHLPGDKDLSLHGPPHRPKHPPPPFRSHRSQRHSPEDDRV